jgi:ariadne-1
MFCFTEFPMCIHIQNEELHRVVDMLSIRKQDARTLLIYHRWDVNHLFEVYVEKGKEFMFAQAGVSVDKYRNTGSPVSAVVMCEICIDKVPSNEVTRMDCGHCFCNSCKCLFNLLVFAMFFSSSKFKW